MSRFLQDSCLNDTWLAENCSVVIFILLWEIPMGDSSTDSRCSSWMASHHCDAFSHAVVLAFTVILTIWAGHWMGVSAGLELCGPIFFARMLYWLSIPRFPDFFGTWCLRKFSSPLTNRFINSRRASRWAQEIPTQRSGGALGHEIDGFPPKFTIIHGDDQDWAVSTWKLNIVWLIWRRLKAHASQWIPDHQK